MLELRKKCPCAKCVDEVTGIRKNHEINEKTRPLEIKSVGRYALSISFNDGHKTGIYSFQKLRNFTEEKAH